MQYKGSYRFVVVLVALGAAVVGAQTASKPSLAPAEGFACGQPDTRVTICFPGTRDDAKCEYAVTNSTYRVAAAQPCPTETLFGEDCKTLPGLMIIAFGPCQAGIALQNTAVTFQGSPGSALAVTKETRGITAWLDLLGLQSIEQIGGFLVRGYAYQLGSLPSTAGVDMLPNLRKVGTVVPVTLDNARLSPLTILGAAVPQFDYVTDLESGMLIENTPNANFSGVFGSLHTIKGTIRILGNIQLTSLDGLQGMALPDALGNLEILSNPRLTDIDALSTVFACREDGTTRVDPPSAPVGVVEVKSDQSEALPARCLLTTADQVCSFIATSSCPVGTNAIGTGFATDAIDYQSPAAG